MYNRFGIWQSASDSVAPPEESSISLSSALSSVQPVPPPDPLQAAKYLSVPLEMIPTDTALPCALYVRISDKFVQLRKIGDVLTAARAKALSLPSAGLIYVSLAEWNLLLHSLEAVAIAADNLKEPVDDLTKALRVRSLLVAYSREIELKRSFTPELFARVQYLGDELAKVVFEKPALSIQLLRRFQDPSLYHVNHIINVAIYSLAIGKKQELDLQSMKQLATAALVHNVGNTLVPAELLFKPSELTVEEKGTVDTHSLNGAGILQQMKASKETILTAIQHHDRYDGKGVVGRAAGNEIHLFARICSIADVFDAITTHRPYHMRPLPPQAAVRRMAEMQGKFDPSILPTVTGQASWKL
jgi:HD-GYP domain-containing protein (c-di-GMP phosphodiesterase class II)